MKQETWEERFDQIYIGSSRTRIKDFIRIELQNAREEERDRMKGYIDEVVKENELDDPEQKLAFSLAMLRIMQKIEHND
jgi:hypothetical protein